MWDSLKEKGEWKGEIWNRKKSGVVYPEWLNIIAVRDEAGDISHYISVFHDVSEMKKKDQTITLLSNFNPLTQLPNRFQFNEHLDKTIKELKLSGKRLCLMSVNIDRFQNVNESLGYTQGDILLKKVGERLVRSTNHSNTVYHIGGDEFLAVIEINGSNEEAVMFAQNCCKELSIPYRIEENEIFITFSAGLAFYPEDGDHREDLIKNSDTAKNKAKANGGNRIEIFQPSMNNAVRAKMDMSSRIRKALENREFLVYYQPRVTSGDRIITGMEALVRWRDGYGGFISPMEFIPVAEENGLIEKIGEFVLQESCRQLSEWMREGFHLKVSVNLSNRQFQQKTLFDDIKGSLKKYDLAPSNLELEITESLAMADVNRTVELMHNLTEYGIEFSLDDFGTGYSSFYYLKNIPFHCLKIDQSFVKDLARHKNNNEIVAAIISMAKKMNLKTVAEGVETWEQLKFLEDNGCDEMQGYYFSKPLSAFEFRQYLELNRGKAPKASKKGS